MDEYLKKMKDDEKKYSEDQSKKMDDLMKKMTEAMIEEEKQKIEAEILKKNIVKKKTTLEKSGKWVDHSVRCHRELRDFQILKFLKKMVLKKSVASVAEDMCKRCCD